MIAARFSHRITVLVIIGAVPGLLLAIPLRIGLASLAAPFIAGTDHLMNRMHVLESLPVLLWGVLCALPTAAAVIGWVTTQMTVRSWLAGLP